MEESRQAPERNGGATPNRGLAALAQEQRWLECLAQLATFSSEHDNLIEVARYTYQLLKPLLMPDAFMLSLYYEDDDESEHIYAVVDDHEVGLKGHKARNKLTGSRIEPMIRGKKLMLVEDWRIEEQHNYQIISLGHNPPRVRTLLDIPMMVGDVALGGLHLQSYRDKAWSADAIEFARTVAALLVGAALHHMITTYRNSKKSYAGCLHTISQVCSSGAAMEEIYAEVVEVIARFIGGICTLLLKEGEKVRLAALFHSDPVLRMMQTEFAEQSLDMLLESGWAMPVKSGKAILISTSDDGKTEGQKWLAGTGLSTTAAIPLLRRGEIVGQISIARFAPASSLHDYEVRLLEAAGVYLALAMENEQLRAGRLAGTRRCRRVERAT